MPRTGHTLQLCAAALLLAACTALGCRAQGGLGGGPVVRQERIAVHTQVLRKLAVIPFYPAEGLVASAPEPGADPAKARWEIAAHVSKLLSEALAGEGIEVIAPSDVELAFVGEGHPVPRLDPPTAAALAGRLFGASGVVLGRVHRYREREGGPAGATRPASVAFEITLHQVPTGRRLWSGRFEETQQSLTANVFRARRYPGAGTRWLSASEFARWGAGETARALVAAQ